MKKEEERVGEGGGRGRERREDEGRKRGREGSVGRRREEKERGSGELTSFDWLSLKPPVNMAHMTSHLRQRTNLWAGTSEPSTRKLTSDNTLCR